MDKRHLQKDQDVGCYLPTPEEIQRETEKIRAGWDSVRLNRARSNEVKPVEVTKAERIVYFKSGERRD